MYNDVANAWIVAVAALVFVAVMILLGGPRLMAAIRAGATRRADAR